MKKKEQDLQIQINLMEKEKSQIDDELQQTKRDSDEKIAQMVTENKLLEENIVEIENNAKSYK